MSNEVEERAEAFIDFTAILQQAIKAKFESVANVALAEVSEQEIRAQREEGYKNTTWYVSPAQLELMSNGDREATDAFFADNKKHLISLANAVLRKLGYHYIPKKTLFLEVNDLINQVYVDIRYGKILFDYTRNSITRALCRCMRYAGVGGAPDDLVYHYRPKNQVRGGTFRRAKATT